MDARTRERKAIEYLIDLIYKRAGIRLNLGKQALIQARLGKRMRHYGFESLCDYCDFLQHSADPQELTHVVDALTTNFTNFLREERHFQFMVEQALPELLTNGRKRFRIWSAACASGEEPYSIAFYLEEHFPLAAGWDWLILATDICTKALAKAQQAIYAQERLQVLPPVWQRKFFQRGCGQAKGFCRVKNQLRERLVFRPMNLLAGQEIAECFDLIFCRNVMIYFDRLTQQQLAHHLCRHLARKGYLIIGHSESLTGISGPLRCLRPSIYRNE